MKTNRIPLSVEAVEEKKNKLKQLLGLKKEVMKRLIIAREMGDLSENGAYKAAKFELGGINRQLRELNFILKHAYVPEVTTEVIAGFGKTITLKNKEKELVFTLVGEYESDPEKMKFSLSSPIGLAVNGKQIGDKIVVVSPNGKLNYSVIKIE
ncbi:MAG: GreA/GreB family elongation factor [Candidatus Pacebacteria bacterium]|nr:GreA/GreB family elongation factor [Candidatus Paceibacterota bacterium]